MLPFDAKNRQFPSIVEDLGRGSYAFSMERNLNFSIQGFTGGCQGHDAQIYHLQQTHRRNGISREKQVKYSDNGAYWQLKSARTQTIDHHTSVVLWL